VVLQAEIATERSAGTDRLDLRSAGIAESSHSRIYVVIESAPEALLHLHPRREAESELQTIRARDRSDDTAGRRTVITGHRRLERGKAPAVRWS